MELCKVYVSNVFGFLLLCISKAPPLSLPTLNKETQIVPILLGQLHKVGPQRLRGGLDELLEVDDVVLVDVRLLDDLVGLALIDPRESKGVACGLHLLDAQDPVAIDVGIIE